MLFDLQADHGSVISAYLVPDTGGTIPKLRVLSQGKELLSLDANVTITEFVSAGRHSTGTCGFKIDDSLIPNLASYTDLELVEANTNILIYRRPVPTAIPDMNMFRLETHLLPLWRIDDALRQNFQYWYKGIDRFGRETSTQVFCVRNGTSSYISGRLLYKNYEFYLSKGIKIVAVVRDPYDELAERLILLKNIGSRAEELLGERDAVTFAPVSEALSEFEQFDDVFLKRFFKRAPEAVFLALSNPLVRQLTGSVPEEQANLTSVASALSALSQFECIGLRSEGAEFSRALAETLGLPEAAIPTVTEYPRITELGARLRQTPHTEAFLEKDLEVFHLVSKAFKAAVP